LVAKSVEERRGGGQDAAPSSGGGQIHTAQSAEGTADTGRSGSRIKALTELDDPDFGAGRAQAEPNFALSEAPALYETHALPQPAAANDSVRSEGLGLADFTPLALDEASEEIARAPGVQVFAPTDQASVEDNDTEGLSEDNATVLAAHSTPEPNYATRAHTHVAPQAWFDATLTLPGMRGEPSDARQLLAWRFKAAFAAYRLLLPTAPTAEARALMVNALRRYERLLRRAVGAARDGVPDVTEALHHKLTDAQAVEMARGLSELEGALLTLDECLPNDQFRRRFTKEHVAPKMLLRYARFLGSRPFDVGYRRDRFEAIARELLTARKPSGKLLLMPRKRAGAVLMQLVRGLPPPPVSPEVQTSQLSYLRDALDRLESLTKSKQFFDSGFYLDVYGFKIAMHERITSPEYLYLCVAIETEVHNRLQIWSHGSAGSSGSLAALQVQLRAQQEAAQAAFPNFHRPLASSSDGRSPVPRRPAKSVSAAQSGRVSWLRFGAAGLFVLLALGANLFTSGVIHVQQPAQVLTRDRLHDLSPLLIHGKLTQDGKRFEGGVARPAWFALSARERQDAAQVLAQRLKAKGVEHAQVLAYKDRAIQVEFGSVVFIDAAR
jgi:hypothetical protein